MDRDLSPPEREQVEEGGGEPSTPLPPIWNIDRQAMRRMERIREGKRSEGGNREGRGRLGGVKGKRE